ncbi:MAG: FMN-binding protein [Coriobacteriia bacterium]|nr:FMN-binding protein [Coriobacteriia bacterium]MBS5477583.1 FMN-binding protein [Coriobacteriia bacterium]
MATYVDGLYTGTARGIGGKVNVQAIFDGGQMIDFQLTRLSETSGIGAAAGPIVAQNILAAGGTEGVDAINGSTVTSNAILQAADMALKAAEGGYNDGVFSGTARGIGGRVDVEATFEAGKMVDFKTTRLAETSGIGAAAGPILVQQIKEAGTTDGIDGITGATVTCNAILAAANMAIDKASGAAYLEAYEAEQAEKAEKEAAASAKADKASK